MSSMQERVIESIVSDFQNIKEFEEGKGLRKECSMLTRRVESAKKLCEDSPELMNKLIVVEKDIIKLLS